MFIIRGWLPVVPHLLNRNVFLNQLFFCLLIFHLFVCFLFSFFFSFKTLHFKSKMTERESLPKRLAEKQLNLSADKISFISAVS